MSILAKDGDVGKNISLFGQFECIGLTRLIFFVQY